MYRYVFVKDIFMILLIIVCDKQLEMDIRALHYLNFKIDNKLQLTAKDKFLVKKKFSRKNILSSFFIYIRIFLLLEVKEEQLIKAN